MEEKTEFLYVAQEQDIPLNERLFIEINEQPIVIFNLGGKLFAIGDVCTHDNGPVGDGQVDGYEVVCPRHGARFDIRSGKATKSPAFRDVPSYQIKVEDGKIFIKI
ncbi:Rieske (2Fe-2S) protein [Leptolinea tardivitalis]|uniref:Rieske domain-containing protein n=1 Tax=Leptolinea tardivitalis TaxID=229920 RepID=A0A0P6WWT0_9CHLR|nr:non-heme iron oxygenase ferredoxin subunit [Leptolinea tardivitalis]KPL74724.1 hypothetical protein ADM99_01195 [Leptolinea tardivitalis]GAP22909.1 ferredoxin subunits of nitrite reductase and ring-hydroxylating dioxygenases [Leptolinea tardivitalis]